MSFSSSRARPAAGRSLLPLALPLLAAAALACGPAQAEPPAEFPPAMVAGDVALILNGAGTRQRAVAKVYDVGLYLVRRVHTVEEVLALPGPKRLQFTALREMPGTELGYRFVRGMGGNATKEQMQRHTLATARLIDVFSARSKLAPGESFAMEYTPGRGTTFYIAQQPQGEPVGDAEFFSMVLQIWLGPAPADATLKEALLGLEKD